MGKQRKKKKVKPIEEFFTYDIINDAIEYNDSKIFIDHYDLINLDNIELYGINNYLDYIFGELIETENYEYCQTVLEMKNQINSHGV